MRSYMRLNNVRTDRIIVTQIEAVPSTNECPEEGIPQGSSLRSALNVEEQAGYRLTIQYTDATHKNISEACRQHCNNYDAAQLIRSALITV